MEKKTVILHIYGKVQGVGFRYYTQKKARELGIDGYVMNRPDGSVYVEAEGEEENLDEFVLWCREGPGWARVTDMNIQKTPVAGYDGFSIK